MYLSSSENVGINGVYARSSTRANALALCKHEMEIALCGTRELQNSNVVCLSLCCDM